MRMRATTGRGMSARSIALGSIAALAGLAAVNQQNALEAQRKYPPCGDFLRVRGGRLHKLDPGGAGPTVVLLHGSGATLADMEISGIDPRRLKALPTAATCISCSACFSSTTPT